MTDERLAEIKARAEAATPGPWEWCSYKIFLMADNAMIASEDVMGDGGLVLRGVGANLPIDANAEFIADARTAIPELIAEIDHLRAELERLREETRDAWGRDEIIKAKARAAFFEQECRKRANILTNIEWASVERGWLCCPNCEGAMPEDPNFQAWHQTHPKYHLDHYPGCEISVLKAIPTPPEAE